MIRASDALCERTMLVRDIDRPAAHRGSSEGALYAVFATESTDWSQDAFLGLVGPGTVAEYPERVFGDLVRLVRTPRVEADADLSTLEEALENPLEACAVLDANGAFLGAVTRRSLVERVLEEEHRFVLRAHAGVNAGLPDDPTQGTLEAATTLSRLWTSEAEPREILRSAIRSLTALLGARYGAIAQLDAQGRLEDFATAGLTAAEEQAIGAPPTGAGLLGVVLNGDQALRLDDMSRHPASVGFPPGHPPMRSLLAVGIRGPDRVLGRVYLCDKRSGEPFTPSDEALLQTFAGTLGMVWSHHLAAAERRRLENQMAEGAKLEAVGRLAAGIAHEINTPMQFIGDNVRFLQDAARDLSRALEAYGELRAAAATGDPVPPAVLRRLEDALEACDVDYALEEMPKAIAQSLEGVAQVARIVAAMKAIAHPGGEEKTFVDVVELMETALTVSHNEWKYVADVERSFSPDLPPVEAVPGELTQVVLNLVVNAAHAIAEKNGEGEGKGRIRVGARREGDHVLLSIEDDGCGIPEPLKDKVVEPFFTTKEVGKGTGQGLALARSIVVEGHGGTLDIESLQGEGTTVRVRLPVAAGA